MFLACFNWIQTIYILIKIGFKRIIKGYWYKKKIWSHNHHLQNIILTNFSELNDEISVNFETEMFVYVHHISPKQTLKFLSAIHYLRKGGSTSSVIVEFKVYVY